MTIQRSTLFFFTVAAACLLAAPVIRAHVIADPQIIEKRVGFWGVVSWLASAASGTVLGAAGKACVSLQVVTCFGEAIGALALAMLSSWSAESSSGGGNVLPGPGGDLQRQSSTFSAVKHHLPNGTVLAGLHTAELHVGVPHRVLVHDNFETFATRLKTGHVRLSAKIGQNLGSVSSQSDQDTRWSPNLLSRSGDDEPGETGWIDAFWNDEDIGGTGTANMGDPNTLANTIGGDVADIMVNQQAETVCAALTDPTNNDVMTASEWYIRAEDGTTGSLPSGACDNAQAQR